MAGPWLTRMRDWLTLALTVAAVVPLKLWLMWIGAGLALSLITSNWYEFF